MRDDALRACRQVDATKQRYLLKEELAQLDRYDRCDALLWMVWPLALRYKTVKNVLREEPGFYLQGLVQQGRAVKVGYGKYRFKPIEVRSKGQQAVDKKKPHTIAV